MKALILVDIQVDFLPGGALAVPEGDAIIPAVNQLQKAFDLVVATQDWHPEGHGSFASSHAGKQPFDRIDLNGLDQVLWPDHCVQGSPGAAFAPGLDIRPVEAIFRKGTDPGIDSYSGFYDNGHRKATGMGAYLKGREVDEVAIVGLAGDYCVAFTALDAADLGFSTAVIEDATRSLDAGGFRKAMSDLKAKGGRVVSSADVLPAN